MSGVAVKASRPRLIDVGVDDSEYVAVDGDEDE